MCATVELCKLRRYGFFVSRFCYGTEFFHRTVPLYKTGKQKLCCIVPFRTKQYSTGILLEFRDTPGIAFFRGKMRKFSILCGFWVPTKIYLWLNSEHILLVLLQTCFKHPVYGIIDCNWTTLCILPAFNFQLLMN